MGMARLQALIGEVEEEEIKSFQKKILKWDKIMVRVEGQATDHI